MARDVTLDRARERDIAAARDRAERLFDAAPHGIAVLDADVGCAGSTRAQRPAGPLPRAAGGLAVRRVVRAHRRRHPRGAPAGDRGRRDASGARRGHRLADTRRPGPRAHPQPVEQPAPRRRRRPRGGHHRGRRLGADAAAGPAAAPRPPRPADRLVNRRWFEEQLAAACRPPLPGRWPEAPSCCWTSTTSRTSTTSSATGPATACWSTSRPACARACAPTTCWHASAATSSPSSCRGWTWWTPSASPAPWCGPCATMRPAHRRDLRGA